VLENNDLVIPAEAMWSTEYGTKHACGTRIMKQPGDTGQKKTGHLTPMEIAVKCLLDNPYIDGATRDLKVEYEAYKFTSWNALGGILVFTRFTDLEAKTFSRDPCFMVIKLPSTGMDGPALTLTSEEVWVEDRLVHL
jgi:hypothetical protein